MDHSFGAANAVKRVAEKESLDHEVVWFNLHELRSVLRLAGPGTTEPTADSAPATSGTQSNRHRGSATRGASR